MLVIAAITLTPGSVSERPGGTHWCLFCGTYGFQDFLLNVLLFTPLGFGLWRAGIGWRRALLVALASTITIETLQLLVIPGRDANLGDIVANTTGGMLGWSAFRHVGAIILPDARQSRRLAMALGLAWSAALLSAGWALHPSPTGSLMYFQRAPRLAQYDAFGGAVLDARLDGVPTAAGAMATTAATARHMSDAGALALDATVVAGPAPRYTAPVLRIGDEPGEQVAILAQRRDELRFSARLRASDLRMRYPAVMVNGVFPVERQPGLARIGDTLRVSGWIADGRLHVRAVGPLGSREATLTLRPAVGWTLITPWTVARADGPRAETVIWLGVPLLLLGFWSAGAIIRARGRSRALAAIAPLLPLLALALADRMVPWDWMACVGALAVGAAAWHVLARSRLLSATTHENGAKLMETGSA